MYCFGGVILVDTSEQTYSLVTDGVSFIMEGIGALAGVKNGFDPYEKKDAPLFSKLQAAMSNFLQDSSKDEYGEATKEDIKQEVAKGAAIEQIELNPGALPDFENAAKEQGLKYSIVGVTNTKDGNDIIAINFSKADIDKATKVWRSIAKKAIDKQKTPIAKQIKNKQQQMQQEKNRSKDKNRKKSKDISR